MEALPEPEPEPDLARHFFSSAIINELLRNLVATEPDDFIAGLGLDNGEE